MHRNYTGFRLATDNNNANAVSLFNASNVPRTLTGSTDVTFGESPDQSNILISVSQSKTDLLNGITNTATWNADSVTPQLPYNNPTNQPGVPLASGTTVIINSVSNTQLSLTPSTTTPVGYQWFVVNESTVGTVTLSAVSGATMFGCTSLAPQQGVWVRLIATDFYILLNTPVYIDPAVVANMIQTLEGTALCTISANNTIITPTTYAAATTIVLAAGTTGCSVALAPIAASAGFHWYVVNATSNTVPITYSSNPLLPTVVCTVYGGTTIGANSAIVIRQCGVGDFVVVGTPDDLGVVALMSAVFNSSAPTNPAVLQLPSGAAPAGSTTTMNGPNGQVQLYALTTGVAGCEWLVVNATLSTIPVTGVMWDVNTPAPTVHGAAYIPTGRVALIRQYSATEFEVLISHPEDASPQSLSYFRRETYNPGTGVSVIHLPRHPTNSGPILKHNTLINVTAANTIVYLWQEFILPVGGYVYQFLNSSSTDVQYQPASGVTGFNGAKCNNSTSAYWQGANTGGLVTIGIDSATRNMTLQDTVMTLPDVFRAGSGLLATSNQAGACGCRLGHWTTTPPDFLGRMNTYA